jgi:hypothetical protein
VYGEESVSLFAELIEAALLANEVAQRSVPAWTNDVQFESWPKARC